VFSYTYISIAYANKVVNHAIFTKSYLGHVGNKVEKDSSRAWVLKQGSTKGSQGGMRVWQQ